MISPFTKFIFSKRCFCSSLFITSSLFLPFIVLVHRESDKTGIAVRYKMYRTLPANLELLQAFFLSFRLSHYSSHNH